MSSIRLKETNSLKKRKICYGQVIVKALLYLTPTLFEQLLVMQFLNSLRSIMVNMSTLTSNKDRSKTLPLICPFTKLQFTIYNRYLSFMNHLLFLILPNKLCDEE